jgi:hypothetical protein
VRLVVSPEFEAFRVTLALRDQLRLWTIINVAIEDRAGEDGIWIERDDEWWVAFDEQFVVHLRHDLPDLWVALSARFSNSNESAAWDDQ